MPISFRYDHPHYLARRTQTTDLAVTASKVTTPFVPTFPVELTAATITVTTAGTGAAATWAVSAQSAAGTFVVGTYAASTATAGSQNSFSIPTPLSISALGSVTVTKGNEATGAAVISLEYRVPFTSGTVAA